MRYKCVFALVVGTFAAGIASPQSIPSDLASYLSLTETQVQAINSLNIGFNQYTHSQENLYYDLQSQVSAELAKASPDPGVVGSLYGQMAMIGRDYNTHLAQMQTNVGAVLSTAQVALVNALLGVARLQPLVSDAQSVDMEPASAIQRSGGFGVIVVANVCASASAGAPVQVPPPLVNYFNLSDAQSAAIQNAIQANRDYVNVQSQKIREFQSAIQTLTAAQTIDTTALGADYIAIAQIQNDEKTQAGQLITTVRSVLTGQQQPQLAALDNAMSLSQVEYEAVQNNILVLPPDLAQTYSPFGFSGFPLATVY